MGATRDVALNELPIRGISINSAASGGNVTVVASDSGIIFINKYETNCTYTLPSVTDCAGKWFWFYNGQTTATMTITGTSTDVMMVNDTADYDSAIIDATTGSCVLIICDGTNYYCLAICGTITGSG